MEDTVRVVVSLTSIDSRLGLLRYCIDSLLRQSLPPDVIYLNLSRGPYLLDKGIIEPPDWLSEAAYRRVKLSWVKNDGPYRKLLPVINKVAEDDFIITVDDDQIYGENWLKKLVEAAGEYPDHIVCGRAKRPIKNIFNRYQSYPNWEDIEQNFRDIELIPTGNAGVLYRKSLLDLDFLFDENRLKIAPTSDDLWIREASFRMSCPVLVVDGVANERFRFKSIKSLTNENTKFNRYKSKIIERATNNILIRKPSMYLGMLKTQNDYSYREIKYYSSSMGTP